MDYGYGWMEENHMEEGSLMNGEGYPPMGEVASSTEEFSYIPSSPVTLECLSVEEQEIWADLFDSIESTEDGQPDCPPALQIPLHEEEIYDEVYEPEDVENSGIETPIKEEHSQSGREDGVEEMGRDFVNEKGYQPIEEVGVRDAGNEKIFQKPAAFDEKVYEETGEQMETREEKPIHIKEEAKMEEVEAMEDGEEEVHIWNDLLEQYYESEEDELEGMVHIVEDEDGRFSMDVILWEGRSAPTAPLFILDGYAEEDIEETSDGDESDGAIVLDSDDDDTDMEMAQPKIEGGSTGQEKRNTVEEVLDPDDELMNGVINGLKKLEEEKRTKQAKTSNQKAVKEEGKEQPSSWYFGSSRTVRDSPQPSTSRQLAHRPLLDLDDDSDEESETGDEGASSPSHNDLTRPAAGKKPQYCRKCGNHGLRRLKNECGEWQSVGKDELKFIRGCLKKKCHCPKCEKVDREREAASKRRKAKKDEERRS